MATNNPTQDQEDSFPAAVSQQRWEVAQAWEREFWRRQNIPSAWWKRVLRPLAVLLRLREPQQTQSYDDRNYWWKKHFDDYACLPTTLENVCELGCGPYTNVRLFRQERQIRHLHCSDPLAEDYIRYPKGWLGLNARAGNVSVDFHPAEQCPFATGYFDVTIMINVLDHVRDARLCLQQAMRITKPGGHLVFGQDLTSAAEDIPSNPGHPFVLNHEQLLPLLDAGCSRVLCKILGRDEVEEPQMHYGALVYIGRRHSGQD